MEDQGEQLKTFDEIVLESIDEILNAIGGSAKNAIYLYITRRLGVSREQLPYRITALAETLTGIFGAGSRPLELAIIRKIEEKAKISYPLPAQAISLQDCIVFLRHQYESSKRCYPSSIDR
ncbi:MAG: hypothetical protein NWE93_01850 [Candidatus Bathyarchaeota archaeon]|nr:hypothetical protein [Candidatus Bathyarchaeota archaeon]